VLTLAFNKIGNFSIYPEPTDGARLIVNGPYRYIRHPMYAALSLMMLGIALYNGHGLNALAWALLLSALVGKILREEQFLPSVFPQHAAYAKRTAWLIPRLW
jgi:protein-S-isoprenylcysteine O-methyltransferase Ste14